MARDAALLATESTPASIDSTRSASAAASGSCEATSTAVPDSARPRIARHDDGARSWIEAACRLIDEQHSGVAGELDRERQAPPLADGEVARMPSQARRELGAVRVEPQEPGEPRSRRLVPGSPRMT